MDTHFGSRSRTLVTGGVVSGLAGGIALAAPLVVWDWVQGAHRALELPMAATAWLFGLQHFSDQHNLWGSIVLGMVLLGLYAVVSGLTFAGLADHVFALRSPLAALLGGVAWSAASFMLFWYMLLPIARDGAPFRATAADPALFVAPNWVWILGFTVLGLVTGAVFAALHRPRAAAPESRSATEREFDRRLHYAA